MRYRRYGKFMLKDYWKFCIVALAFTIYGILLIINEAPITGFIWIVMGWIPLIQILIPHRETFMIKDDSFIIKKGKKQKKIYWPDNFTAIIAYADICSEFAKRVSLRNETINLEMRYSVSFVRKLSVDEIIQKLHKACGFRYSNSYIEQVLKFHFIYNFICDQKLLEECLRNRNYTLIVPEPLLNMIDIENLEGTVFIDKGL